MEGWEDVQILGRFTVVWNCLLKLNLVFCGIVVSLSRFSFVSCRHVWIRQSNLN